MSEGTIDYKGEKGKLLMVGTKENVPGWSGEIYVAVIQYGDKTNEKFDVVPDSTDPKDVDELPEVKTFPNRGQAISHFMNLEKNKDKWK